MHKQYLKRCTLSMAIIASVIDRVEFSAACHPTIDYESMVHGFTCVTSIPCITDASTCSTAKVSPHDFAGELTQTSTDHVPDHFSCPHKKN